MLEGKYINDVFYSARMNGREVVVKCSTKCPWSIGNEYRLAQRMFAAAPEVIAEPLNTAVQGNVAMVVTERVAGPTLTELLAKGLTPEMADNFADDFMRLAAALQQTGIIHRDLFADNFLLGADGHLKVIDWQLAIDRNDYHEDPWVVRHWKFHYVVFGVNRDLPLGHWNDFRALFALLTQFPSTPRIAEVKTYLQQHFEAMEFAREPSTLIRFKLRMYALSLRLQMLRRSKRHPKYQQLLRRYRTIVKK